MNLVLRYLDWVLFVTGLAVVALGFWFECGMPGFVSIQSFPWVLVLPFLTGAVALHAARWFAAAQLAVKILERFNSEDMYKVRRLAWNEAFLWFAGDRYLLVNFMLASTYPNLSLRAFDKDKLTAVARLLEFVAELQAYHNERQLSGRLFRRLMRDRMSWFAPFFISLQAEIRGQQRANGPLKIPYKSFYVLDNWASAIDWVIDTLDLRAYSDYQSQHNAEWTAHADAELLRNFEGPAPPDARIRLRLSGLKDVSHLSLFKIVMDTSDASTRDVQHSGVRHPAGMGHVRLRRCGQSPDTDKPKESEYLVDYFVDVPLHGFQRYFIYLEHAPDSKEENKLVSDLHAVRYWVSRLSYQGVGVKTGFKDVLIKELGLCVLVEPSPKQAEPGAAADGGA